MLAMESSELGNVEQACEVWRAILAGDSRRKGGSKSAGSKGWLSLGS